MNDNIFLSHNHLAFESISRFSFPEEQYFELVCVIIIILLMILTLFFSRCFRCHEQLELLMILSMFFMCHELLESP